MESFQENKVPQFAFEETWHILLPPLTYRRCLFAGKYKDVNVMLENCALKSCELNAQRYRNFYQSLPTKRYEKYLGHSLVSGFQDETSHTKLHIDDGIFTKSIITNCYCINDSAGSMFRDFPGFLGMFFCIFIWLRFLFS